MEKHIVSTSVFMRAHNMSGLIGVERKKRLTQKQIQEFAYWALLNEVYDKYTCGKIKQLYEEASGVSISESTVRQQLHRWVLIDGKLYDVTKPYLFPEGFDRSLLDG